MCSLVSRLHPQKGFTSTLAIPQTAATTGIPACIFILSNNRDGEHRERKNEILFIDARKLGTMASRRLRVFKDADVARIADTYHTWRNLGGSYTDVEGFCKAATLAEVAANNYVLSPGRYVGSEAKMTMAFRLKRR